MYVKREDYQGGEQALLKFGKADTDTGILTGKDAIVSYLKGFGVSEDEIDKAAEELGDGDAFPFILSNANVDREGDSVSANWELGNYKRNPVVLWAHDYNEEPVGRAAMTFVGNDGQLRAIDRFHDITPRAKAVAEMYRQRILNAVSVGFRGLEWDFSEDRGGFSIDFRRQELLEHSAVPVPAHPEALLEARSLGIDLAPIKEFYERALDDNGFNLFLFDKTKLEKCWANAGDQRVTVAFGLKAGEIPELVDLPEADPLKAVKDLDTTSLVNELVERGLSVQMVIASTEEKAAITEEDSTVVAEKTGLTKKDLAAVSSDLKSVVSDFSDRISKLKTDLTGRLD